MLDDLIYQLTTINNYDYVLYLSTLIGATFLGFLFWKPSYAWKIVLITSPISVQFAQLIGETTDLHIPLDIGAGILGLATGMVFVLRAVNLPSSSLLKFLGAYFLWMGITTFFSTNTLVSAKWLISQIAYFFAFTLGSQWALQTPLELRNLYIGLGVAMLFVLPIIWSEHAIRNFDYEASNLVPFPYFREHTVYGAYTAWLLCAYVIFWWYERKIHWLFFISLIAIAWIFTYSRGGWLSAIAALLIVSLLHLFQRLTPILKFSATLASFFVIGGGIFSLFQYDPEFLTKTFTRAMGPIAGHLASSFDVKENLSNLERINRWVAAWQMIQSRPLTGFGPNTFVHEYSAYQKSLYKTKISVELGEVGGAHNEYLATGADMGVPGLILLSGIYLLTLLYGFRIWFRSTKPEIRMIAGVLTTSFLSYALHALINNFMDHEKMATLIYLTWGGILLLQKHEAYA
ncbi:MAG: O-antigen ligase family protein [Bacteroidia bacterium]